MPAPDIAFFIEEPIFLEISEPRFDFSKREENLFVVVPQFLYGLSETEINNLIILRHDELLEKYQIRNIDVKLNI